METIIPGQTLTLQMRKLRLERRRSRSRLVTELGPDPGSLLPRGGQEQAGRALHVAVGRQDGLTAKRLGFASPWPGPRPQHHCQNRISNVVSSSFLVRFTLLILFCRDFRNAIKLLIPIKLFDIIRNIGIIYTF